MTWTPITREQQEFAEQIVLWIRTAKAAGYPALQPDWLPSRSDLSKSALFERIRSGKAPLPEPPPVAHSCPWYAVVEDPNPHFVGSVSWAPAFLHGRNEVVFFQKRWKIVCRCGESWIVADGHRATRWRFRLFFDRNWRHPSQPESADGGWFLSRAPDLEPKFAQASLSFEGLPDAGEVKRMRLALGLHPEPWQRERIAAAAIRLPPVPGFPRRVISLPPPARHDHVIRHIYEAHNLPDDAVVDASDQGFVTSMHRFVEREEACRIAFDAGQIVTKHGPPDTLFSEDMW